jgi:hypothetical protein
MKSHAYGKGKVIWNLPLNEVLSSMGVERDFVPENIENKDQHFDYIHRATADEDSKWPQRKTRGGGCSRRPTDSKPMADQIPKDRGAPPSITMATLTDWTESADPGVRYFSGSATYHNQFLSTQCPAGGNTPSCSTSVPLGGRQWSA